jgi:hypothetical protein
MFPHHPRTRKPHDRLDLRPPVFLVTVHRAFRARRFFLTESATLQPQPDVTHQLPAIVAQSGTVMLVSAVDAHHGAYRFPLALETSIGELHRC